MVDTMPTELAARSTAPKHFLALLGTLLVLTIAWVFATPLGAVPDEPAHMIRAAASARGEAVGVKPAGDEFGYPVVQVPDWVAESFHLPCEVGDASKTAECVPSVGDDTTLTPSSSSSASNSPVFYTVVGLPSLFITGDAGLYAMRIMSAILTSLLLAAMILALRAQSRTVWPVVAGFVTATPMVFFLGGSTNVNGVEAAGAGAVAAIALLLVRTKMTDKQLWIWSILLGLSVIGVTSGRTVALLWVVIAAIVTLIIARPAKLLELIRKPAIWVGLAIIILAVVWVFVWFQFISITAVDPRGYDEDRDPSLKLLLSIMVEYTFNWWGPWIGQFGWLEVSAPIGVQIIWQGAIAALLFGAFVMTRGRARVATIFIALAVFIVPIALQGSLWIEVGWIWQGRYMLPVYLILMVAVGVVLDMSTKPGATALQVRFIRAAIVLLAASHLITFVFVLRRFIVANQNWLAMFTQPEWQPPLTWIGISAVLAVGLALQVALVYRWTKSVLSVENDREIIEVQPDPQSDTTPALVKEQP